MEEFDAYLRVLDGPVREEGAKFEQLFPDSTLLLPVYELMTRAFRAAGQREEAIRAAERGLAVAPDYVPLLVERADLLVNASLNIDRAAESAERALALLETAKAPLRVSPEEWVEATSVLRARSRSALAMARFKRGDNAGAVRELEAALAARSPAEPSVHYRLGRLYALLGRTAEARKHLQEAARSEDPTLRRLAAEALAAL